MISFRNLTRLVRTTRNLGLTPIDAAKFLWSYYGSRLPGALSRREQLVHVNIHNGKEALQLAIRINGYDYDVVDEIFARRCYDVGLSDVKTILDLGANIGLAAAFFSRKYPGCVVACVEPVPKNLAVLHRNIALNSLPVQMFPVAVGASNGRTEMELSLDPRQSTALQSDHTPPLSGEIISVEIRSVPSLLTELGWAKLDLMKIDIEGGEKHVLGGRPVWLSCVNAILGEGHLGNGYTIERARSDLVPLGFTVDLLDQRRGSFLFLATRHH